MLTAEPFLEKRGGDYHRACSSLPYSWGRLILENTWLAFADCLPYNGSMYNDDEDDETSLTGEAGSDELLAADDLHLPASANILVRLHALRAWLQRRQRESELEVGNAALAMREATLESANEIRPRRRATQETPQVQRFQTRLAEAQQRTSAYDEALTLLEECVAHTTASTRVLVEFYLSLEELMQAADSFSSSPWLEAMQDVQQRVEQVGTPAEEEG